MRQKKHRSAWRNFVYYSRYRCGEYALRGFIGGLPHVPRWVVSGFTRTMAWVTFLLLWRYRNRMAENVASVLGPEISDRDQQRGLVWRAWLNFARGVLDTTAIMHWSKDEILANVALQGEEHLRRALESGKGVLALSAHLGSFTLIGGRLAAGGYPFSVIVKQPADNRFAKLLDDYRSELGIHTISAKPRREAAREILKALRKNRIVLVLADEFKSGDVMVDFFGMNAPAPRGPATLALRTGAVTVPMFAIRQPDGSSVLTIGPPISAEERGDVEASIMATTAVYTRCLEDAIRKYPDQWNWLGLPRRDGKPSRAELARLWKQSRQMNARESSQGANQSNARL